MLKLKNALRTKVFNESTINSALWTGCFKPSEQFHSEAEDAWDSVGLWDPQQEGFAACLIPSFLPLSESFLNTGPRQLLATEGRPPPQKQSTDSNQHHLRFEELHKQRLTPLSGHRLQALTVSANRGGSTASRERALATGVGWGRRALSTLLEAPLPLGQGGWRLGKAEGPGFNGPSECRWQPGPYICSEGLCAWVSVRGW